MAYNYNYPYQMQPYPVQMNAGPTQPMQIQNGGFVSVRSEIEARNYPVAYGNSVTFKDETQPYVYTKTMGFSQLDRPVFEKYKLVKEDAQEPILAGENKQTENLPIDDIKGEIKAIWKEIEALKKGAEKHDESNGIDEYV